MQKNKETSRNTYMKRQRDMFDRITDTNNLYNAFQKAARGKRTKSAIVKFKQDIDANIAQLRQELIEGTVQIGKYYHFTVYEPKQRLISCVSFPERIIQHAVMNVCEPRFEKHQIAHSYACRTGKGLDLAIEKAQWYSRHFAWFAKLDVRKYFDTVDHKILINLLARLFKDHKLIDLFWKIIDSHHVTPGKGIPIGNLTSQHFANYYLSVLDHFIKEQLRIPGLVRYMDDFLIFTNSKQKLFSAIKQIECFLIEKLALHLHDPVINHTINGIPFLGYQVQRYTFRLAQKSARRFRKKFKQAEAKLRDNEWDQREYVQHVQPLLAFIQRAETTGFREKLFGTKSI